MKETTNFIRTVAGRKSIPINYLKHASDHLKSLDDLYSVEIRLFDTQKGQYFLPVVFANAEKLAYRVMELRNFDIFNTHIKILIDGGKDFIKVSISIFPKENGSESLSSTRKRAKYQETINQFQYTGVKKLILLAVVPVTKETYNNVKTLFNLCEIHKLSYKLLADVKLLYTIVGMQTASATYCCPFCFITLGDLGNTDEEFRTEASLKLKSFGDLDKAYKAFLESGGHKSEAKNYQSTVNESLLQETEEKTVIEVALIPELHIVSGIVNHLFWSGIVPLLGEEKALLWPQQKLHFMVKNYHGKTLEGNCCREMLRTAEYLKDPEILGSTPVETIVPFLNTFKNLDQIVTKCFSGTSVIDGWQNDLEKFKQSYYATKCSITPKVHILMDHLGQCLNSLNGESLGLWSEQVGETVHSEFAKVWQMYKVSSPNHPKFSENLRSAVVRFSSGHV
jgi:hypothetical protein